MTIEGTAEMIDESGPKKTYYSISEVCSITNLEPHVLRYWESEFAQLRPKKNRAGNRAYREKDIDLIQYIKHLLYEEQFTIPGARKKCVHWKDPDAIETPPPEVSPEHALSFIERKQVIKALKNVAEELRALRS